MYIFTMLKREGVGTTVHNLLRNEELVAGCEKRNRGLKK